MANPKHIFDFEGILSMDINQQNWKEVKQKLEGAFGQLKVGIDEGMAKEEAEKFATLFNKVLYKAKLPQIGVDDLIKDFDKVAYSIEKAIGLINNIDTSALKGIETSLNHISTQVDKIVDKMDSIKPKEGVFDNFKKEAKDAEGQLDDLIEKKDQLESGKGKTSKSVKPNVAPTVNDKEVKNKSVADVKVDVTPVIDKKEIKAQLKGVLKDFNKEITKISNEFVGDSGLESKLNALSQKYVDKLFNAFDFGKMSKDKLMEEIKVFEAGDIEVKDLTNKLSKNIVSVKPVASPDISVVKEEIIEHEKKIEIIKEETEAHKKLNEVKSKGTPAKESGIKPKIDKQLGNDSLDGGGVTVGIDKESLKQALSEVTYNVKITHDDTDKTANKISLDDSALKQTLQEVFGNILNRATEQNDGNTQGQWAKDSTVESIKGVLDNIQTSVTEVQNQDWAQVIVQAIETESGQIIETIKLMLPQSITEGENKISDDKLINAFNVLTQAINDWKAQNGGSPRRYFDEILNGGKPINVNVVNAMEALGMMAGGKPTFNLASVGGINTGVAISDELVYHTTPAKQAGDLFELMEKQNRAYAAGASISRIIAAEIQDNIAYQLQTKAPGTNLRRGDGGGFLGATDEQIDRLLYTLEVLEKEGLVAEFRGDNIMYDPEKGFSIIDLSSKEISNHNRDSTTADEMLQEIAWHGIDNSRMDGGDLRKFRNRLYDRKAIPENKRLVNADTIKAEQEAQKRMQQQATSVNVPITPSVADGAVAKAVADDAAQFPPTVDITPTFDKGKIQAALDNIGDATLGVNLSTSNIATAVKEALYAEAIQKGFTKLEFNDVFEKDIFSSKDEYKNILTWELFDSLEKAQADFDANFKGKWADKDTMNTYSTEEMLERIVKQSRVAAENAPTQESFAQIIVDAINTQGGNIVETIKLILPQKTIDNASSEAELINAFNVLSKTISAWSFQSQRSPSKFFESLLTSPRALSPDVKNALQVLGMMSAEGKPTFALSDTGMRNQGVAIAKDIVLPTRSSHLDQVSELKPLLDQAHALGASVPRILSSFKDSSRIFELQTRAAGTNVHSSKAHNEFLNATDEQIDRLLHTFEVLEKVGLHTDFLGENILFDQDKGFSLVDLETSSGGHGFEGTAEEMVPAFLSRLFRNLPDSVDASTRNAFKKHVQDRFALPADQRLVNDKIIAEEKLRQEALKRQQQSQEISADAKITPTMEEGAIAKLVQENVEKTPAVVKVTPVVDGAEDSAKAIGVESQEAVDAAQAFVEAANAKKEFVKANQMVKKSAEESEKAVEEETEATERSIQANGVVNGLAKEKQIRDANDNLLRREEVRKAKGNDAIITTTDVFMPDDDGNEQFVMQTIIRDMEKFAKETKKTEDTVKRAQKKYDEFMARFQSKTGGRAQFVTGFNEAQGFKIDSTNIEEAYNKMTELQKNYAQLEQSFRKGQSSLNPFVNAINKSENIENIFGGVEAKFNNLISRSNELTVDFEKLRKLSEDIKAFSDRMNDSNEAKNITAQEFSDFAKQVGEFNALKTKVEGEIKNEGRNKPNRNKHLKDLENLYIEAEQTRAKYEASGSQKELEHIKNISLKIAQKKEEIDLTAQEIAMLKQRSKAAHEAAQREIAGAQADKDIKKRIKEDVKHSRDQFRVNRANSVYNSGRNVQDSLGILPEDMDVSGIESVQKLNIALENMSRLREVVNQQGHIVTEAEGKQLKQYTLDIQTYSAQVKELMKNYEMFSDENSSSLNATFVGGDAKAQIEAAVQAYEGGRAKITAYDDATRTLTYTVKTGANEFTTYTAGIRDADGAMRRVTGSTKRVESFMDSFKRKFKEITKYFGASSLMYKFINEFRKGIQYIREIDSALTELKKVTDATEETYDKFLDTASKTAAKVGSTIKDVVSSTADWARLGYSIEQAAKFAESTQILMNVSEFTDVSRATDTLISAVQAFGYTADTSMDVVDLLNTIGNNYAISTADLAQSLTKSSASLVAAGGNLAEAAALTATANKIIQDADSVGTALKTTSLRLRGTDAKVLEEEGLDSDGAVTSKSKLRSKVQALSGVDILTATGEYKSTYEILSQIADVWANINDMDQAALLELISGKRNSSVIAAILQNPEELKDAFEDAMDAEGSALRENEKYLDSIQGRIDLLTNATQTMWKNALDSDVVKFFVDLLTKLVKLVDKIGLIKTALAGVFIYLTAFKKQNPFSWIKSLTQYLSAFKGRDGFKQLLGQLTGIAPAMKIVTAETVANTIATQTNDAVKTKALMTEMGLTGATGALSVAQKKQAADAIVAAVNTGTLSVAQGQAALATLGFSSAVNIADGSIKKIDATTKSFMASNPIGWILAIISVLITVVTLFSQIRSKTERLTDKLKDLKSEISEIETNLDSVNSELKTIQDRMTELLAMDTLSFVEKEELDKLKEASNELQRDADLLEADKKRKQEDAARTFVDTMESKINDDTYDYYDRRGFWDKFFDALDTEHDATILSAREFLDYWMGLYQEDPSRKEESEKRITKFIGQLTDAAEGLDYGIDDDTDAWLDYVYNLEDEWAIMSGGPNAKTNAIKRIFDKEEYSNELEKIEKYVEALAKGDASAKKSIENIINNNNELVKNLEAAGVSASDAIDYFTSLSSTAAYDTIEGKMAETTKAASKLSKALSGNFDTSTFDDLEQVQQILKNKGWVDADGELMSDAIAEYFGGEDGGISEKTRAEIERLVKQVYNGKLTVEDALKEFELFSVQSTLDIYIGEVKTNFKDVFVDLEEADGLIDTFAELGEAIGSAADALDTFNQAEAEMAYSGQVSIETALKLMEYTDDYGSVLQVVDGKLQLTEGAEEALVETRIASIKTSAQAALEDAKLASQKAWLAVEEYKSAMQTEASTNVVASAWDHTLAKAAGFAAGIKALFTDETWSEAYNRAYNEAIGKVTEYESKYTDSGLQALVDAANDADDKTNVAQSNYDLAQNLTVDSLKGVYSSDEASGGNNTKEEAEEDLLKQKWEALINKYENELALITNERDLIQAEIDKAEARGGKASAQYYQDLIRNSNEEKDLLQDKYDALAAYLETYKDSIDPETWTEYNNELNETAVAIKECETNTIEWAEALREIDTHYFKQATDEISRLGEEIEFVQGLLEDEDVADENGNWSDAGITRLGLYTNQMEEAAAKAKMYQDEIDKLNTQYANGELSEEQYQERLSELVSDQQDAIQSYEDAKDGIIELNEARIDAIKDGIDKEIEAYEDLIDLKKEELDAERDLYDFRKNVKKQTKDIATLERRIAALSGSTAASDIAERRKLEAELHEAREGLNDTYYERSKDQQSQALDDEAEAFRESKEKYIEQLEEQLKDTETLIQQSLMDVLLNADSIYEQLAGEEGIAAKYGIQLSDKLTQPWKDASAQATAWKNELQNSMTSGEYAALIGEGGAITAFANGVATKMKGSWNSAQTAVQGYVDFLTGSELGNKFNSTITGFGNQIQTIIDKWNGVRTAVEAAYEAQNRTPTVGGIDTSGGGDTSGNGGNGGNGGGGSTYNANVAALQAVLNTVFSAGLVVDGKMGNATTTALRTAQSKIGVSADGKYGPATKKAIESYIDDKIASWRKSSGSSSAVGQGIRAFSNAKAQLPLRLAKGTMGLEEDQWTITNEPWIGEELSMYATPQGTLSFMRAGSTVIPADLTKELIDMANIGVDGLMDTNKFGANINMISNAINKPEINLDIAEFLHVDKVDKDTMPELERFVDKKMNELVRQLNYSIKKFK